MCLITDSFKPRIATEPITVYKLYDRAGKNLFISPFMHIRTTMKEGDEVEPRTKTAYLQKNQFGDIIVTCGFLHALTDYREFKQFYLPYSFDFISAQILGSLRSNCWKVVIFDVLEEFCYYYKDDEDLNKWVILKMEVPVGAKYYVGKSGSNGIASTQLVFKEVFLEVARNPYKLLKAVSVLYADEIGEIKGGTEKINSLLEDEEFKAKYNKKF